MKYRIVTFIGAAVIAGCCVLSCVSPVAPKTEPYQAVPYFEDIVIVEPTRIIVRAEIQRSKPDPQGERSGMLCDIYEGETDEPETAEEERNIMDVPRCEGVGEDNALCMGEAPSEVAETIPQTICSTEQVPEEEPSVQSMAGQEAVPIYQSCNNTEPISNPEFIRNLLRANLEAAGIGWWYPYACAQITQESHWNVWAVSADGLDYGLLQYRLKSPDGTRVYWTEPESIFDVNAQIRKYVQQVSARIAAGLSVEEIISRHFTSDYCPGVNWQYVNDVLRWMN